MKIAKKCFQTKNGKTIAIDTNDTNNKDTHASDTTVLAVSIAEAGRKLGVCPRTVATLIQMKALISRKVGRRRLIPVSALEAFLRRDHPTAAPATP